MILDTKFTAHFIHRTGDRIRTCAGGILSPLSLLLDYTGKVSTMRFALTNISV